MPLLAFALVLAAIPEDNPAPLNAQIVNYCKTYVGQTVGRGECSDLANGALKTAKGAGVTKEHPKPGDYVWGNLVYILEKGNEVYPATGFKPVAGDIIQFRDVEVGKTTVHPDGSSTWYKATYGHHTAVIGAVREDGSWLLYEQNSNQRRYVTEGNFVPADIQKGYLRVYRPKPLP